METLPVKKDWTAFGVFIAMLALNYAVITAVRAADARTAAQGSYAAQASGECTQATIPVDAPVPAPSYAEGEII